MNAFENLLVDNKFLQLANFQHSTTFNFRQLSTFNFDNFQYSTTFNFRQLSTFNFDNFQYSTTSIFDNFQTTSKIQLWRFNNYSLSFFVWNGKRFCPFRKSVNTCLDLTWNVLRSSGSSWMRSCDVHMAPFHDATSYHRGHLPRSGKLQRWELVTSWNGAMWISQDRIHELPEDLSTFWHVLTLFRNGQKRLPFQTKKLRL